MTEPEDLQSRLTVEKLLDDKNMRIRKACSVAIRKDISLRKTSREVSEIRMVGRLEWQIEAFESRDLVDSRQQDKKQIEGVR